MSKVIKGRGKILFYDEKDREKMNKKYPELDFEKMNPLIFTTKYKGNKQFELEIQVEDTKIPCAFNKWAEPWKYGTKVELRLYFKDLKKKATIHITGGIQHELFQFFRYDYEKMIKDDKKLNKKVSKKTKQKGGKQTRKKSKKDKTLRNKYKKISHIDCAKKHPKSRDKTLKCLDKKVKDLKSLESEFPQEMKSLKKELKEYEKTMNTFMTEAAKCQKYMPNTNKVKKCAQEVGKKYGDIFKDNKELSQIYTDNLRDKLHRMIDHTQKVDLGELGKLNL